MTGRSWNLLGGAFLLSLCWSAAGCFDDEAVRSDAQAGTTQTSDSDESKDVAPTPHDGDGGASETATDTGDDELNSGDTSDTNYCTDEPISYCEDLEAQGINVGGTCDSPLHCWRHFEECSSSDDDTPAATLCSCIDDGREWRCVQVCQSMEPFCTVPPPPPEP